MKAVSIARMPAKESLQGAASLKSGRKPGDSVRRSVALQNERNTMNSPLEVWNISADDFPADGNSEEKLWFLVRYAVLAPSTHNTQPWRFRIHGNVVELYADFARALPVVDPQYRELIMSCGAALLHLRIAIRYFGHAYTVERLPDPDDPALLARVHLGFKCDTNAEDIRRCWPCW